MSRSRLLAVTILLLLFPTCFAHIEMSSPIPRGSKYGTAPIDVDLKSPLSSTRPWPCQGKQAGFITSVNGASTIRVSLEGSAIHNGGEIDAASPPHVSDSQNRPLPIRLDSAPSFRDSFAG